MNSSHKNCGVPADNMNTIQAPDSQTALEWCAVLESQNIEFILRKIDSPFDSAADPHPDSDFRQDAITRRAPAWIFVISPDLFQRAERDIRDYESERTFFLQFKQIFEEPPKPLRLAPALPMMALSAILAAFHLITGPVSEGSSWFSLGELSTAKPEVFQWWRPITALTLHADAPHILGNALFAVFFGGMLAVEIGGGAVVAIAVLSGIMGNITSLWFNADRGYAALGFSTAVFGLLGAMAALRTRSQTPLSEKFTLRFWLPLGAAVALLGMTGSGPGSDLTGHFFGFFWGFVIGWFSAKLAALRGSVLFQTLSGCVAAAAILAAWISALSLVLRTT
ncbi:MAG: rhomboid family intramembrane serine protease [Kiritimatiellaeota bacterium]|nr:rhomboid family intramembrane serine protease [Kiritimatiellota bacterium]